MRGEPPCPRSRPRRTHLLSNTSQEPSRGSPPETCRTYPLFVDRRAALSKGLRPIHKARFRRFKFRWKTPYRTSPQAQTLRRRISRRKTPSRHPFQARRGHPTLRFSTRCLKERIGGGRAAVRGRDFPCTRFSCCSACTIASSASCRCFF